MNLFYRSVPRGVPGVSNNSQLYGYMQEQDTLMVSTGMVPHFIVSGDFHYIVL